MAPFFSMGAGEEALNAANAQEMSGIVFRNPGKGDGKYFWEIAKASKTLDLNSTYHYLLMCRHFGKTCIAAEEGGNIVGFVVSYVPPTTPDAVFVWQVAVDEKARGRGLGVEMLVRVFGNAAGAGVKYLDATITPSNQASVGLFTAAARALNAPFEFEKEFFTSSDFGQTAHEPEILFHIGPVQQKER